MLALNWSVFALVFSGFHSRRKHKRSHNRLLSSENKHDARTGTKHKKKDFFFFICLCLRLCLRQAHFLVDISTVMLTLNWSVFALVFSVVFSRKGKPGTVRVSIKDYLNDIVA